MLRLW